MDFSNLQELFSLFTKYFNNTSNTNNQNPISNTNNVDITQKQNNKAISNSFPEPLNITQDNVLDSKLHTQNTNIEYTNNINKINEQEKTLKQLNNYSNFSNPILEITKFLNADTLKLIQQFIPMLNNLKGNNIFNNLTNLMNGNKKNNTDTVNVVTNKNEINDIESLIRIDTN